MACLIQIVLLGIVRCNQGDQASVADDRLPIQVHCLTVQLFTTCLADRQISASCLVRVISARCGRGTPEWGRGITDMFCETAVGSAGLC
jgi:hypothetical protein